MHIRFGFPISCGFPSNFVLEMKSLCTSWGSILMSKSIDLSKIQLPDVSPRTIFIAIVVLLRVTVSTPHPKMVGDTTGWRVEDG